jgi:hypothetical protein
MQAFSTLWSVLLESAVALMLLALLLDRTIPPQHLPWKPLRLDDPIGRATAAKIARVGADPAACRRVLSEGGITFADLPDRTEGEFCAVRDAVRLTGGTTPLRPAGPGLTCRLALGVALWDRQVVQPAARRTLGSEVAAIEHYGSYACRRQYGAATGRPSEHARANAFDVAGFRLADGRRITVASDYRDEGPEGRFLREVGRGACEAVRVVLGPDYNAAHRDHFHLDQGPFRACR